MFGVARTNRSRIAARAIAAGAGAAAVGLLAIGTAAAQTAGPAIASAVQINASGSALPWPHKVEWMAGTNGRTPPTFTEVFGSPNPVRVDVSFTITARECDRVADVHATGRMTFVDVTKGKKLGTVTLSPSRAFVNCGKAKVIDHEKLRPGKYKIRATYLPGGAVPVPASAPATYKESVKRRK